MSSSFFTLLCAWYWNPITKNTFPFLCLVFPRKFGQFSKLNSSTIGYWNWPRIPMIGGLISWLASNFHDWLGGKLFCPRKKLIGCRVGMIENSREGLQNWKITLVQLEVLLSRVEEFASWGTVRFCDRLFQLCSYCNQVQLFVIPSMLKLKFRIHHSLQQAYFPPIFPSYIKQALRGLLR